jgi:hypothetical protein
LAILHNALCRQATIPHPSKCFTHACRKDTKKQISTGRSASPKTTKHKNLIVGLAGLGLSGITEQQVEAALQKLYPQGVGGVNEATLLRTLFVDLMRQNR